MHAVYAIKKILAKVVSLGSTHLYTLANRLTKIGQFYHFASTTTTLENIRTEGIWTRRSDSMYRLQERCQREHSRRFNEFIHAQIGSNYLNISNQNMATTTGNWIEYEGRYWGMQDNRIYEWIAPTPTHKKCNDTCMFKCPLKNQNEEIGEIKEVTFDGKRFFNYRTVVGSSAI